MSVFEGQFHTRIISRKLRDPDDLPLLDPPRSGMSADEAALCEAAYRAQTAANLDARSAVEAAVEAAEKEASEFVEENATQYRKLKVPFPRKYKKFANERND